MTTTPDPDAGLPGDSKTLSRDRFGAFAQTYVQSATHAAGYDLDRLLAVADPQPGWTALDIATGGGHTALKLAPHVRQMVAADIAIPMLNAARTFITGQGAANVTFVGTDAEALAFADATFDLVTCRIAAHHFPDVYAFVRECARVLKPGGRLVIQDHDNPTDRAAADWLDTFERLRDPGHHRIYAQYEWEGLFADCGLTVEKAEPLRRPAHLLTWAAAQRCTPAVIERLHVLLRQAPQIAADWIAPRAIGTDDAAFDHVYVLISGVKAA